MYNTLDMAAPDTGSRLYGLMRVGAALALLLTVATLLGGRNESFIARKSKLYDLGITLDSPQQRALSAGRL